jgi:hypothetical protein
VPYPSPLLLPSPGLLPGVEITGREIRARAEVGFVPVRAEYEAIDAETRAEQTTVTRAEAFEEPS